MKRAGNRLFAQVFAVLFFAAFLFLLFFRASFEGTVITKTAGLVLLAGFAYVAFKSFLYHFFPHKFDETEEQRQQVKKIAGLMSAAILVIGLSVVIITLLGNS